MKTTDIKIAFVLILNAILAILSLTNCSDDTPDKMHWSVSTLDQDNVEITYDPSRRPQVEIVVGAEGGECQLACYNYEHVSFREKGYRANVHLNRDCGFHAEITNQGVITISFGQMTEKDEELCTYFIIDGETGNDINTTVVKVIRRL